ncbi:MAG TPA: DUF3459 domain-containing protein, partial [Clostridia bacterium]|nr:DUF3459 domain-containing protein [Clostridia bacterium]
KSAGFTTGTPWLRVNPNYKEVNIEAESRAGGVTEFYKKAIALRKAHTALTYGVYAPVDYENKKVIAYTRSGEEETLLIAVNLTGSPARASLPEAKGECLLSTHAPRPYETNLLLAPYEGVVFRVERKD